MTAALKMAAPGELCAHTKKLMIFCKADAKSIKAMRQHVAVTEARMQELLADMLRHNLVWRQSNGMYKTCNNKLHLLEPATATTDSMAALTDPTDCNNAGLLTAEEASELASAHEELNINAAIDNASELDMAQFNETKYISEPGQDNDHVITGSADAFYTDKVEASLSRKLADAGDPDLRLTEFKRFKASEFEDVRPFSFPASEFAPKHYDLDAMANEFEAEQERGDQHVIDNLDAKQRVLNYCQMLLSPTSTEMRRCLDELQMDLAVIRLQQERSV